MKEILISALLLAGSLITFLSAVGLVRFPDVYSRLHAVSKSSTLGIIFILSGVFMYFVYGEGVAAVKILLGIFFVFLTSPLAAHMLARAAYRSGIPLWRHSIRDDLKSEKTKQSQR